MLERDPGEPERRRFDAVVLLRCSRWGFLLPRVDRSSLGAFVDVDVRMVLASGHNVWDESEALLSHGRQTLDELGADPELARRELRDVLEADGYRLAIELLYPRGKP